jgi:hypothetical protein
MALLRELQLWHCPVCDAGCADLAASRYLHLLQVLGLEDAKVSREGLRFLARSSALRGLTRVALSGCPLGPGGLEGLLEATWAPSLVDLALDDTDLDAIAGEQLLGARLPLLRRLHMSENSLGDAFAKRFASRPPGRLRVVSLSDAGVGDEGAEAFAVSRRLAGLKHLMLTGNPISPAGRRALAESVYLSGCCVEVDEEE